MHLKRSSTEWMQIVLLLVGAVMTVPMSVAKNAEAWTESSIFHRSFADFRAGVLADAGAKVMKLLNPPPINGRKKPPRGRRVRNLIFILKWS